MNSSLPSTTLTIANPTSLPSWLEAGERCRQLTNTPETLSLKFGKIRTPEEGTASEPESYLEFHRYRNGIRLPNESEATVDIINGSGLIRGFRFPPTPDLDPLNMTVNVSLQQARQMAAARASQLDVGVCAESTDYPVALSYYFEEAWPWGEGSPEYFYLCKTARPKLGYFGVFEYGAPQVEWLALVIVDPDTGEILFWSFPVSAGTIGGPRDTKNLPMLWDWEPGPIRVLSGKRSLSISKGRIDLASSAKPLKSDGEVVLQRARLNVLCQMNKAAGLIWHEYKGKRIYGRPDPETRRAIGQLLQKKISRKERKQP